MDNNHNPMLTNSITCISFFLITIITFFPLQSHSKTVDYNSFCRDIKHSYKCGNISDIFYPFWGENRPFQCGAGNPFYLNCHKNITTTILLSSQNFTVLEINTKYQTMKLKRTDLSLNLCAPQFGDTYLFPSIFQYLSSVNNITIFYNCSSSPFLPKKSLCGSQNHAFYHVVYEEKFMEESLNCNRHIQVPIGADFLVEKSSNYYYDEHDFVQSGLDKGFDVKYSVNKECLGCLGSEEGVCFSDYVDKHIELCYYDNCSDGSIASSTNCSLHNNHLIHWNWKSKVVVGFTSARVLVFFMCILVYCCFRYKISTRTVNFRFMRKNDQDIETFLNKHGVLSQKRYKFSEVKKITNSFKTKLGQGGFGVVYKGELLNGCNVAVKILNKSKENGEEFINEVASISRTSHVNVVSLLGFCFEGSKKALIFELMPNGSLDSFIYKKGPRSIACLSWEKLYEIAKGIARGLDYLHRGCNTRILHFDIKPHNILLDENFCPKISDFGLAKLCPKRESMISMSIARGTIGYIAPEVCSKQFGGVSQKSDVYSYGMMILEMTGVRKSIDVDGNQTSEYFPDWIYNKLEIDTDLRIDGVEATKEDEIARAMTIVGLWCIQTFPNNRPTISRVIEMLEGNIKSLEIPPKPMLSSPTRSLTIGSSTH